MTSSAVNDDRTVVVCADVSGKGFAAALLAAQVQSYFRAMVQAASVVRSVLESASVSADVFRSLGSLPLLVVSQLNTTACRHMRLQGRYATLFFAEIDGRDGAVNYVNAGHNPPLLLVPGSGVELLSAGGPPVGLLAEATYEVGTVTLPADGTLLMYTDGVIRGAGSPRRGIWTSAADRSVHRRERSRHAAVAAHSGGGGDLERRTRVGGRHHAGRGRPRSVTARVRWSGGARRLRPSPPLRGCAVACGRTAGSGTGRDAWPPPTCSTGSPAAPWRSSSAPWCRGRWCRCCETA